MTTKSKTTTAKSSAKTTKIKADLPATKMTRNQIQSISRAIAELAIMPERDALLARRAAHDEVMTTIAEKTVTDDMVNVLPEGYRPERVSAPARITIHYDSDSAVYNNRPLCDFTLTRPVYCPTGMRWSEWPKAAMHIFPQGLIDEGKALRVEDEGMQQRYNQLFNELVVNLTAARTVRNACKLWPEAAEIILEKTDIAAEVEVPLSAILGRYLKMLPAPEAGVGASETGQPEATDDTASTVGETLGQTFDPNC